MAMDDQAQVALQRRVNKWSARIVPVILVGIVGYVSWTTVALLAVNRLIHPPSSQPARRGAGIAIVVVFCVLFVPMAVCYFRVLAIIATDPGLVPRPSARATDRKRWFWPRKAGADAEKALPSSSDSGEGDEGLDPSTRRGFLDRAAVIEGREPPPAGIEEFWHRDVFECDIDGLPRWCSKCLAWKPDRSHHSSELGRCVYKMDHYCPWAGGVIAENNFKFFIQFCFYTALFCAFVLIVMAYYLATMADVVTDVYKVDWIVSTVLAGLFFLFTAAMALNSLNFVLDNTGTIESLSRGSRAKTFAVLVPPARRHDDRRPDALGEVTHPFFTVTYPLGSASRSPANPRTFAILHTPASSNPYRLASRFANFKAVFGERVWDWFLPVRHSPCAAHGTYGAGGDGKAMYPLGPVLDRMLAEAGLDEDGRARRDKSTAARRRQSVQEYHEERRERRRESRDDAARS